MNLHEQHTQSVTGAAPPGNAPAPSPMMAAGTVGTAAGELVKDYDILSYLQPEMPALAAQLMQAVCLHDEFYHLYTKREEMEPKLQHTRSIYLTKPKEVNFDAVKKTADTAAILACQETWVYAAFRPAIDDILDLLRKSCNVHEIGRVFITKLLAKTSIYPHIDEGPYFRYYHRYHVPLFTAPGCIFTVGETAIEMVAGVLYAINNCRTHSVQNNAEIDRVHLIVDAR